IARRLREIRLKQLQEQYKLKAENLAKGHGDYREIVQDEFLKEVTSSARVLVHFYHRDFERCKIIDMVLTTDHMMRGMLMGRDSTSVASPSATSKSKSLKSTPRKRHSSSPSWSCECCQQSSFLKTASPTTIESSDLKGSPTTYPWAMRTSSRLSM
ncbi:hypothetical protein DYB32_007607, partial [Aphanomyces invadans]